MNSKPQARESRSVRLREDEWITAEAIARLYGESSAGLGLRTALAHLDRRLRRSARRDEFLEHHAQVTADHAAKDAR